MTVDGTAAVPLWLLYEDEIDAWRASQTGAASRTGSASKISRAKSIAWLLRARFAPAPWLSAVGGLGKRQGELSLWHAAGFAERLPPRRFRLAQSWSGAEATQLCSGIRLRSVSLRALPAGQGGARARASSRRRMRIVRFVALAAEALDDGARLDQYARLGLRARAISRRPRASSPSATRPAIGEWVGEELRAANFPAIHAVGRASADAPRLIEMRWSPPQSRRRLPRVALIGKGVCFDSGGLDIKPSSGMALMKKDMGGAAVALALAHMLMSTRHPRRAAAC